MLISAATNNWTLIIPTTSIPSAREEHAAVYDPTAHKLYMFGGGQEYPPPKVTSDLYELDVDTWAWTQLPPAPANLSSHVMIRTPQNFLIVHGGYDGALLDATDKM